MRLATGFFASVSLKARKLRSSWLRGSTTSYEINRVAPTLVVEQSRILQVSILGRLQTNLSLVDFGRSR
jgi:hypothetical protein